MIPKVSVVIAAHNHAHFLPDCLGSVKAQTYPDYEVIVIDNGSTDNTKETVQKLAWDKLRYHYQADTGSVAGPRNTGTKLARGEYVAYLDSDDSWRPDKLAKVMKVLADHPEIDLVTHELIVRAYGKLGEILRVGRNTEDISGLLFEGNCVLGSATVVRKKAMDEIGGFDGDRRFIHVEDYETWFRLAARGKKFFFINEVLGEYRIHSANLSHDYQRAFNNEQAVIRKHIVNYRAPKLARHLIYRRAMARIFVRLSFKDFKAGNYWEFIKHFTAAFIYQPYSALRLIGGFIKKRYQNSKSN